MLPQSFRTGLLDTRSESVVYLDTSSKRSNLASKTDTWYQLLLASGNTISTLR